MAGRLGKRRLQTPPRPLRYSRETAGGRARIPLREPNDGPFNLAAQNATAYDEYGRELRDAVRVGADGKRETLAVALVKAGTVRVFLRGARGSWCGGVRG